MEYMNFIILSNNPGLENGERCNTNVSGQKIFPIGKLVPVIVSGQGCIGIGAIKEIRITEHQTNVQFTFSRVSKQSAIAYYDLYRNTISNSTDTGYENAEDTILPGLAPRKEKNGNNKKQKNKKSSASYFSNFNPTFAGYAGGGILDDEDDED